jgi:hypothetical protein
MRQVELIEEEGAALRILLNRDPKTLIHYVRRRMSPDVFNAKLAEAKKIAAEEEGQTRH